ncbi:MAG: DUF2017 domain-containing protein [Candidatus Nanopelagicales bacterium]
MAVHGFRRTATGRIVLRVDDVEKGLLGLLLTQLEDFVAPEDPDPDADPLEALVGMGGDGDRPEDPALARLFPDAYPEDDGASEEFRRFTETALREGKVAAARTARATLEASGEKVVLTADQAQAWLGALNDLRLTLGTRLGVTEDAPDVLAGLPDDDPRAATYHVYDWLTFLQDSLVGALMPS